MEMLEEARLRQFEVLWAEIARRSTAQQALIAATVTATGTVGGLVAGGADAALLVVLGLVVPVFGLLWLDHARNIGEIGRFIADNWMWSPNWEEKYEDSKHAPAGRVRFYVFVLAISIVFLVPALGGLVSALWHLGEGADLVAALFVGLALTSLFAFSWGVQIAQTWPRRDGTHSGS